MPHVAELAAVSASRSTASFATTPSGLVLRGGAEIQRCITYGIDGVKRLATRSAWWHMAPQTSDAVYAAGRGGQPWSTLA